MIKHKIDINEKFKDEYGYDIWNGVEINLTKEDIKKFKIKKEFISKKTKAIPLELEESIFAKIEVNAKKEGVETSDLINLILAKYANDSLKTKNLSV